MISKFLYDLFLKSSYGEPSDKELSPEVYLFFCFSSFFVLFYTFCSFNNFLEVILFSYIFIFTLATYGKTIPSFIAKYVKDDLTDTNYLYFKKVYFKN